MCNDASEKAQFPTYEGQIDSAAASGEVRLLIDENGLVCDGLFSQVFLPYHDMDSITFRDYAVFISAKGELYRIYYMGQETEWFFKDLLAGYHAKVLSVLRAEGAPALKTGGICEYEGKRMQAEVELYSDCLCILPPNKFGRRYPFVFVNDMKKEAYSLTFSLSTGERCSFSMLGHDLEPLERLSTGCLHKLRKSNTDFLLSLCSTLRMPDLMAAARLSAEGIAACLRSLPAALGKTLADKARNSKMGAYYDSLLSLGDKNELAIGVKALPEEVVEQLKEALLEKLNANAEQAVTLTAKQEDALMWIVFAAIASADGKYAVVEFAFPNEDAATYVFRTNGSFTAFLPLLNRALEASSLRREVFSSPEQKLSDDARMLIARTPAIEALRKLYAGKAVHRSPKAWAESVSSLLGI